MDVEETGLLGIYSVMRLLLMLHELFSSDASMKGLADIGVRTLHG